MSTQKSAPSPKSKLAPPRATPATTTSATSTSAAPGTAANWPDLAGRIVTGDNNTRTHVLPVRVYFEDTDFSGLVYHASYVRWCERGRSDFLRLLGNDHHALMAGAENMEPAAFVVRRLSLEYLKPARIDEVLEIKTQVKAIRPAALVLDQRITRNSQDICVAEVQVVLVSQSGRVLRLAKALTDAVR